MDGLKMPSSFLLQSFNGLKVHLDCRSIAFLRFVDEVIRDSEIIYKMMSGCSGEWLDFE